MIRPALGATALAGALAALLGTGLQPASVDAAGKPRPTVVGVGETEFRLSPYRTRVRAGRVTFAVRNLGEDVHDLAVRGPRGHRLGITRAIEPGTGAELTIRLRRPGAYTLFCARADHAELGMWARIRVRRPEAPRAGSGR